MSPGLYQLGLHHYNILGCISWLALTSSQSRQWQKTLWSCVGPLELMSRYVNNISRHQFLTSHIVNFLSCCADGRSLAGSTDWRTSARASPSCRAAYPRSGWPRPPCRATSASASTKRSRTSRATRTLRLRPEQPRPARPTAVATRGCERRRIHTLTSGPSCHLCSWLTWH